MKNNQIKIKQKATTFTNFGVSKSARNLVFFLFFFRGFYNLHIKLTLLLIPIAAGNTQCLQNPTLGQKHKSRLQVSEKSESSSSG